MIKTINPATGRDIQAFELMTNRQVSEIIEQAVSAQVSWRARTYEQRGKYLKKVADLLRQKKKELAELMAEEMGKPLAQGESEAEKCAWVCEYYADHAEEFLEDEPVSTDASRSYVHFEPLGVILSIMPWNYPLWQVLRFSAPALMAGNGVILKHSENTTGCSLMIEKIMHQAGIPAELFRSIIVEVDQVKEVIENKGIAAVTLTGSTRAGKAVASQAGAALKKTVLELGGSDPYIILEDANLDKAAEKCVTSRLLNSGQSCIAAKRFVVVDQVYDSFVSKVKKLLSDKKIGDPFDQHTDVGPMARTDLRDELHKQVQKSTEQGAECVLGGKIPEQEGAWYPVTLLTNVKKGMPAYQEELFGPVAAVIRVNDEEEAIRVANDSVYGLGGAVFSEDIEKAEAIASEKLQAGCCFVNDFVRSDPRLPFGGLKQSGYGRELSKYGIREFVNCKTVYVSKQGD
ncbi:NAD-dependent succinate-semialdehyde dehydrogenase [Balneola sp. MJW-20]|uniref:NAD-dependent succinate-semialdehyde dehydrogenase n=1 Tax=Gracilimonas aurantiaca TaxID=3234185 RepID=UPI0034676667